MQQTSCSTFSPPACFCYYLSSCQVAGITGEALQSVLDTLERDHGVLMLVEIGGIVRAMTNLGVNKEGVERAVEATGIVLAATQATQQ